MSDDRKFPAEVHGWLSEAEGRHLAELARGRRVLEVGSYEGRSTVCMAQTAASVDCVDPFDGRATDAPCHTLAAFRSNLDRYGVGAKVRHFVGTSGRLLPTFPGPYDLIFVDGDHSPDAARADAEMAARLLAPGGVLAMHDYRPLRHASVDGRFDPGVTDAVEGLLAAGWRRAALVDTLAVLLPPEYAAAPPPPPPAAKPLVFLAMPTYDGRCSLAAAQAFDLLPTRGAVELLRAHSSSSLLTKNFNSLLAAALNLRKCGVAWFAMIHDDIEPAAAGWVDTLVAEAMRVGADYLAAVSPIKTDEGLTSTAVADDLGDPWLCRRLTMREVYELPETFDAADANGPLLLNTGLFVMDLRAPWWDELAADGETAGLCFGVKNRLRRRADGDYYAEAISEDWLMSQELNRRGARLFATRKVVLGHDGQKQYATDRPWGRLGTDEAYWRAKGRQRPAVNGVSHAEDPVHAGLPG